MALTVEELQIVLSCDATTAQAVLDKMEATVKAYTDKFQKYFNNMGGKTNVSVPSLDIVVKDVEKQTKKLAKAGADWKKQYEKTWGESFEDSMKKVKANSYGGYVPSGKKYVGGDENGRGGGMGYEYSKEFAKAAPKAKGSPNSKLIGLGKNALVELEAGLEKVNGISDVTRDKMERVAQAVRDFGNAYAETVTKQGNDSAAGKKAEQAYIRAVQAADQYSQKLDKIVAKEQEAGTDSSEEKRVSMFSRIAAAASAAGNKIASIGQAVKKAFHSSILSKFLKQLSRTIMRMAAMKLIRGTLDSIKQGLEMLGRAGGTAGKAMNQVKAAGQSVKAALGVALMPVVKALAPVFYQVAQAVTAASNAIARFLATLLGQSSYTAATITSSMDDVSSSYGGAGKAAKNALADFDEINLITKSSGGGGGGAGGDTGLSTISEELVGAGNGFAEQLREAFLGGDWSGLGSLLSGKLGELSGKISDWANGLKNLHIGTKVAAFLNGIFSDRESFELAGKAVGDVLTTLAGAVSDFVRDFKWEDAVAAVQSFMNGFFEAVEGEEGSDRWLFFERSKVLIEGFLELFKSSTWADVGSDFKVSFYKYVMIPFQEAILEYNKWITEHPIIAAAMGFDVKAISKEIDGLSESLDHSKQKLAEAELAQAQYRLEQGKSLTVAQEMLLGIRDQNGALTEYGREVKGVTTSTKDLQGSLDGLGKTKSEPEIAIKGADDVARTKAEMKYLRDQNGTTTQTTVQVDGEVGTTVETTALFTNPTGLVGGSKGPVLELSMRPQVWGPIKSTDLLANSSGVTQDKNGLGISFKVRPEVEGGNTTVTALQSIITGFNEISGKAKKANLSVKLSGAKESAVTKMSSAVSKFFDGSKTSTITINQGGASLTQIQAAANAISNFPKKVTVDASVNVVNAEALKKALQNALTASAKITVNGQSAGSFKVNANNVNTMASGGIAYGITNAIIGEYAGASSNPEVVAPLSKLQGILESSGTVSKDTMTRDQANTMIQLLQRIERKEIEVKPSVGLGQVVQQSLGAYART